MSEQLECVLEEEIHYGCTPVHVLEALHKLSKRCEQHKADEPGLYREVGPTAKWSSENLRSNWRVTMMLYRTPVETVQQVPVAEVLVGRGNQPALNSATGTISVPMSTIASESKKA